MKRQQNFGAVMLDVAGLTLSAEERDVLNHPNVGAVILFARNFYDAEQVSALITQIRAARRGDILIAVDQEGGRVQRFQNGFTRLPAAAHYAKAPQLARNAGWLMAAELLAVGVDFSFAPVLDVDAGISAIIGNRAFGEDEQQVAELAHAFMQGMNSAGMAATGKHFPGHGAVALDSHLTLPVDERDLAAIRARDLVPFQRLIDTGLAAVMLAHVLYPQVDSQPAGFSVRWIQNILRAEYQFNGVVFSDDLSMVGAAGVGDFPERARLSLEAGCDMVLICNQAQAAIQVIEALPIGNNAMRQQRLQTMQGKPTLNRQQLQQSPHWQQIAALIQNVSETHHD
jgi:beta-N-acetylhexosaminidase